MKYWWNYMPTVFGGIWFVFILILFLEISIQAQILPPDVGLVTRLSGEVTYWNETYQKSPKKVEPLMKIRKGDHFKLSPGATLQLIYFQNGRQEDWRGSVTFMAGMDQSQMKGNKQIQPEVSFLPPEAYQGIRRVPVVVRRARLSRSGGMMIRGETGTSPTPIVPTKEEREEIAMAKENYQKMRKQAKADDITPELNLLGVLADYEQFEEMEKVIKEALKIQPDHPILKELESWVKGQKATIEK
jgi:hypothetical protein